MKPGDQYKVKEGGWERVQPERIIRTTLGHPFWVKDKGWTPAGELKEGDLLRTLDGWVPVRKVADTGKWEPVYNLRVADHHTYFVGGEDWNFAVWAHNAYSTEVNQIIMQVVSCQGGPNGAGFSHEGSRTGERAKWSSRQYLVEHLREMVGKYYGLGGGASQQIAECAATRILRLPDINRPINTDFSPQTTETFRPTSPAVPPELAGIAHRRYTLTNTRQGIQNLAPISANLNYGGWEVILGNQLGDTPGKKAYGVSILRDTDTGRIYKVGAASVSTSLVGRLESYARDWVARGIRVTAEVYQLHGDVYTAEKVLRGAVRGDNWLLDPNSGAADGTSEQTRPNNTSGWSAVPQG